MRARLVTHHVWCASRRCGGCNCCAFISTCLLSLSVSSWSLSIPSAMWLQFSICLCCGVRGAENLFETSGADGLHRCGGSRAQCKTHLFWNLCVHGSKFINCDVFLVVAVGATFVRSFQHCWCHCRFHHSCYRPRPLQICKVPTCVCAVGFVKPKMFLKNLVLMGFIVAGDSKFNAHRVALKTCACTIRNSTFLMCFSLLRWVQMSCFH